MLSINQSKAKRMNILFFALAGTHIHGVTNTTAATTHTHTHFPHIDTYIQVISADFISHYSFQ